MLDIFSGLRLVVKRRNINIDNAIFRCHWFFTSTLLVSFSLIITARQYVGQPIECHSSDKIPDSLLNSYCWVQSTFTVPQACGGQQSSLEVPYPCIDNTRGREIKLYAYYQWVGIVLFVQGLLFHLPYYLWKLWENGLIKAITGGLRVAVLNEQERLKKKDIVVEYMHDHLGCHKRYALKYFVCEFICLVNLMGQLWATNRFFDGQFLRYGLDVLQYSAAGSSEQLSSLSQFIVQQQQQQQQQNSSWQQLKQQARLKPRGQQPQQQQQQQVDPMTFVFPRMTKCTYFDFGSSGDVQKHDALCLLPLNIINEKIYIALWFWFLVLAILTGLVIVYRLCAIVSESVRCKGLISRCKLSCERDIRLICRHCDVGDWFLFYMVAENVDPLIMREIVASIAAKINQHLELKRELRRELEQEHDAADGAKQRRLDPNKLRLILGVPGERASENSRLLQPPFQPPAPSAPPRRDSFDSEYLANIFGHSTSSRRASLADQIPYFGKIRRRLSSQRRLCSLDSSNTRARLERTPSSSAQNTPTVEQTIHFGLASAPPASQMALQSAGPTTQQAATALAHRRAPRLQRKGSLNLTIQSQSSFESNSSGVDLQSFRTTSSSCIMEMDSSSFANPP